MKIFFDGRAPYGGIGRHVRWLRKRLPERLGREALVVHGGADSPTASAPTRRSWPRAVGGALKRLSVDQYVIPREVAETGADLFHSPNYLVPRGLGVPAVVDCYDLTLLDHFGTKKRGPMRHYERQVLLHALERARCVVTPSDAIRRQLLERFDLDSERVVTIYPQLPELAKTGDLTPLPKALAEPFLLSVGVLEPRKNLARLLDAHARVWRESRVPLVLAGPYGWRQREVLSRIKSARDAVHWLGWVPNPTLAALYHRATVVVQVSLAEGFDLPVLEALAAGAPLVLSELSVHREIAGDLGVFAPTLDVEELAHRMSGVLTWSRDDRLNHARRAAVRVEIVTRRSGIERYLEVYNKALC